MAGVGWEDARGLGAQQRDERGVGVGYPPFLGGGALAVVGAGHGPVRLLGALHEGPQRTVQVRMGLAQPVQAPEQLRPQVEVACASGRECQDVQGRDQSLQGGVRQGPECPEEVGVQEVVREAVGLLP